MKTQATPRPWELNPSQINTIEHNEINICMTCGDNAIANAKLIVKAVNCHDELIAALGETMTDKENNFSKPPKRKVSLEEIEKIMGGLMETLDFDSGLYYVSNIKEIAKAILNLINATEERDAQ